VILAVIVVAVALSFGGQNEKAPDGLRQAPTTSAPSVA